MITEEQIQLNQRVPTNVSVFYFQLTDVNTKWGNTMEVWAKSKEGAKCRAIRAFCGDIEREVELKEITSERYSSEQKEEGYSIPQE